VKKLVLLLGIILFMSCYTDSNDFDNSTSGEIQLLRNVFLGNELLYSFDYYPDGKLMSQTNFSGGAISHFAYFEYANDTVYKTISGIFSSKSKSYQGNSNTIVLMEFDNEDNLLFYYLSNYSSPNCGLTTTDMYTRYGQLYTTTKYDYIDSNCSYNSKSELSNGEQKNNYAITKDGKNNYLRSVNTWPSFEKKHNIIEYKKWDADNNLVLNSSYNSVFVYDNNGYPIQESRTSLSGVTKVYNYEYY